MPFYGAQTYGAKFIELAGTAANGAILGITHPIIEEASSNPATATFVEWYERVNPGAEIDFFAFQGWVAADMFADAIEAAGPSPTRDSVLVRHGARPPVGAGPPRGHWLRLRMTPCWHSN